MKQFILTHKALCIVLACVLLAGVTCAIVIPIALKHEHTFATEWTSDENNHWHKATCEHKDEKSGLAKHSFDDGAVTAPATEETEGVMTYTCTVCGYKKNDSLEKLNHTHKFATEWTSDETNHWHKATCEHTDEISDKAEHTFGDGVVTTAPTEAADGVKTYTCTVCGKTKTESIPKLEHTHDYDIENYKFDATNHWVECSCGAKEMVEPHTYGVWSEKTAAAVDQNKQYSRKCTECEYEDVLTFDNTKTNGTYCVAITEAFVINSKKIVKVQVLRGTISVGDNLVIDGLDGTFTIDGINDSKTNKNMESAIYGQSVSIEMGTEDGDLEQVTNPKVGGHLAYEPETANANTAFTAQITIDTTNFNGNLNSGRTVKLDLYNINTGMIDCSLVLPEGVNVAKDGESYVVTVALPDNASRALWAGMEFTYKVYDSASSSYIIVARGIILNVAN